MQAESTIITLPGGVRTLHGGTRTEITPGRFWNPPLFEGMGTQCPFDKPDELMLAEFPEDGRWRVRQNRSTPFSFHRVIYPPNCWEEIDVYAVGGPKGIERLLRIAALVMPDDEKTLWLFWHVGKLAGQNVRHLHCHFLAPVQPNSDLKGYDPEPIVTGIAQMSTVHQYQEAKVVVGGHRAGECFILPDAAMPLTDPNARRVMAAMIYNHIVVAGQAFVDAQNRRAHYQTGLWIHEGRMEFGFHVPTLNHWGGTEYLGLLAGAPIAMPWSPESTVAHLKPFYEKL